MDEVIKRVMKKVIPTKTEKIKAEKVINFVISKLEKNLGNRAKIVVGGSFAKDTWISGQGDIDLFVIFKRRHKHCMSTDLFKAVENSFKNFEILHGTRDYYRVKINNFKIEIVPALKIRKPEEAENIIDVSPFHVKYVTNKIKKCPGLQNEIRVLKYFMKNHSVYGAETYVSGFSGYAAELLMVYYKSFKSLVENLDKSQPKIYIDIEKHYKNVKEIEKTLTEPKLHSPIILIDPIFKTRNATAALSYQTFSKFLFALRKFLRNPTMENFLGKKHSINEIRKLSKKRGTLLITARLKKPEEKEDVFYSKLNTKLKKIKDGLQKESISVYDYGFFVEDKIIVYFELETKKLSNYKKHIGPPVWIQDPHFSKFLEKWDEKVYVFGTNLVVDAKRFEDVKSFAEEYIIRELKNV